MGEHYKVISAYNLP